MSKKPFLSVVIPVYNEQHRLDRIDQVINYLKDKPFVWEVILVDDGSLDGTSSKLKKLAATNIKIISYKKNKGKGFAVKEGILSASGRFRLFMDADLSVEPSEFDKFLPTLNKFDILIGSRRVSGARILVHQPILREKMGQFFTALTRFLLGLFISDATCGFKCFSEKASKVIFSLQTINRWGFDSEILFIAKKKGFSVAEIPVKWKDDPQTHVRFPQDIFSAFFDLLCIRYNDLMRKYD